MHYKICVIKKIELFTFIEVDADSDLQAKSKAIKQAKDLPENDWNLEDKPTFKTEVVHG